MRIVADFFYGFLTHGKKETELLADMGKKHYLCRKVLVSTKI